MKLKKVTALIMATVVAACAMAGCGKKEEGADSANTEKESATQEGSVDSSGEEEKEEAAAPEKIVFPLEETMEFTSFSMMNGDFTLDTNLVMQTSMENANINITFDSVAPIDLVEKKKSDPCVRGISGYVV